MSSILSNEYGVEEARREKLFKWLLITLAIVAVVGVSLYFGLRSYLPKRKVNSFLELVRAGQIDAAYSLWGCTVDSPCPDYSLVKFREDWGEGRKVKISPDIAIERQEHCGTGTIVTVKNGEERIYLWVDKHERALSFAPWEVCRPVIRVPSQ